MLASLLGQIKGVFGKPYLLAGLLPAIVLFEGYRAYGGGRAGLEHDIGGLLANPDKLGGDALVTGVFILALGLLFFAARGAVLEIVRGLPGRPLALLRNCLIEWQRARYRRLRELNDRLLWDITVFSWPRRGRGFAKRAYLPAGIKTLEPHIARLASRASREALLEATARIDQRGFRLSKYRKRIQEGVQALYVCAVAQHEECRPEIREWRKLLQGADRVNVGDVLDEITFAIERDSAEAYIALRRYPNPLWMQPTALGNRFAALDDYAEKRYGISTTAMWTRLWGVLTDAEKQEVQDGQLTVEVAANLMLAVAVLSVIVIEGVLRVVFASSRYPSFRSVLFVLGAPALSYIAYRVAVLAVGRLVERMVRLVDLKRLQLLQGLGFTVPSTVRDERQLFSELQLFFEQAIELPQNQRLSAPSKQV